MTSEESKYIMDRLLYIAFIAMLGLKIVGVLTWSWWIVTCPFWTIVTLSTLSVLIRKIYKDK